MFNGFGTICADCRRGEVAGRRRFTTLEAARMEAMGLFEFIDVDNHQEVTADEWQQSFLGLDTDNNGKLSVSEWLKNAPTSIQESSPPELVKTSSSEQAQKPPATI